MLKVVFLVSVRNCQSSHHIKNKNSKLALAKIDIVTKEINQIFHWNGNIKKCGIYIT